MPFCFMLAGRAPLPTFAVALMGPCARLRDGPQKTADHLPTAPAPPESLADHGPAIAALAAAAPCLDRSACAATLPAMTKLAEIEAAALRLPEQDRRHLAGKLLGSLPPPSSASRPEEILAEARRRDAEIESGQVQPLTEDAFWAGVRRTRE